MTFLQENICNLTNSKANSSFINNSCFLLLFLIKKPSSLQLKDKWANFCVLLPKLSYTSKYTMSDN